MTEYGLKHFHKHLRPGTYEYSWSIGVSLPEENNPWHSQNEFIRLANNHPFHGIKRGGTGSYIDQHGILEPQLTTSLPLHEDEGALFSGEGYKRRQEALKPWNPVPAEPKPSKVPTVQMGIPTPQLWYSGAQNPV